MRCSGYVQRGKSLLTSSKRKFQRIQMSSMLMPCRFKLSIILIAVVFFKPLLAFVPNQQQTSWQTPRQSLLIRRAAVEPYAFTIDDVSCSSNDRIFAEISNVCIAAFFNDGMTDRKVAPWKGLQLSYLRTLQQSDLRSRRKKFPDTNFMLVARRVYPTSAIPNAVQKMPLILDLSQVHNLRQLETGQEYVRGEILGFVEVTKKPYGIGGEYANADEPPGAISDIDYSKARPVLTNLSVQYEARRSGVGSKLVQACEQRVQNKWNMNEIVLEVEDDNVNAREFYEKRGYKVLFEDPSSRRYDTKGLWLRQLRCKRQIMRKALNSVPLFSAIESQRNGDDFFGVRILQKLKDNVIGATRELTKV